MRRSRRMIRERAA
ncbi:MAG: hypothetical protein LUF32_03500 [Clostridiales bacterium]|nr:hypothetical protein [Clostridiales bacterium]